MAGYICSYCGNLTPTVSNECHNCTEELGNDDRRSIAGISLYYETVNAGYWRYVVVGYGIAALASVFFFGLLLVFGVLQALLSLSQLGGNIIGALAVLALLMIVAGLSLLFGSLFVLSVDVDSNEREGGVLKQHMYNIVDSTTKSSLVELVVLGFLCLLPVSLIVGILFAIPGLNALFGLVLVGSVGYSPWPIYRIHRRQQTRGFEAMHSLLVSTSRTGEVGNSYYSHEEAARRLVLEILVDASQSSLSESSHQIIQRYLQNEPDTAYALVETDRFVDSVINTHEETEKGTKTDTLDLLLELGQSLHDDERLNDAATCYETVDDLATQFGVNDYNNHVGEEIRRKLFIEKLRSDTETAYEAVQKSSFVWKTAGAHEHASESEKVETLELVLELGEALREDKRFGDSRICLKKSDSMTTQMGLQSHQDQINSEIQKTETVGDVTECVRIAKQLLEIEKTAHTNAATEFDQVANQLRDKIRAAEGAQEAGNYKTAIKRYKDARDRFPRMFRGHPDLEEEYQTLNNRLETGFARVSRTLIHSHLPDSLTETERKILSANLPTSLSANLSDVYENVLDEQICRSLFTEHSIDDIRQATNCVTDYQDARRQLKKVVNDPEKYVRQFDRIVRTNLTIDDGLSKENRTQPDTSPTQLHAAWTYVRTIERLFELIAENSNPALAGCFDAIRTALRDRETVRSQVALEHAEALVNKLEPVVVYVQTFPSLSIDAIVKEITAGIESGEPLHPDCFSEELERIDRLVDGEGEQLIAELERFLDEWEGHPAVDHGRWHNKIAEARDTDTFEPIIEPYRTMRSMEDTVEDTVWSYEDLQEFSWEAFEHLIANLYTQQGYETTVTSGSRDMGIDVWAEDSRGRLAIQVKQYARGNAVGREVIQKLESTIARGDADRIIVVTSSSFADTARDYASDSENVELIDGNELIEKLTQYEVPMPNLAD